jgi:hypothetical protein
MSYGPVELLVVSFPGNRFTGEIVPALEELIESGTIQVIDFLFVSKNADGAVIVAELDELGDGVMTKLNPREAKMAGLLSENDAFSFAAEMEPNSSEALLLFENSWATRFAQAIRNTNGQVVINERVPSEVMREMAAEVGLEV